MKPFIIISAYLFASVSFTQNFDKEIQKAERKANDFIYEANALIGKDEFVSAEMQYRKAISQKEKSVAGTYNLAHSYYKKGNYGEALFRSQEAAKNAISKTEKHKAYHSIGNILMQNRTIFVRKQRVFTTTLLTQVPREELSYQMKLMEQRHY